MQRDVKAVMDGGIGGALGTLTMSTVMVVAERTGLMHRQPPEAITAAALDAAGMHGRDESTQDLLSVVMHFGFGIATGGLFGALHRRLRLPVPAEVQGIVFGTLVWVVSYKGWVPALGIMPPPEHDEPGRPTTMVVAHWVFGGTLGAVVCRLR